MADSERRKASRQPLVLAAEIVELARGAKFLARTSDVSRTGCYVDTLNPIPQTSQVRLRLTHHNEIFEALGHVIYVSPGLGMGIIFDTMASEQQERLDQWLHAPQHEF